ncbi:MAG: penicillin acylase family protein, partial [Deltaproteobacteria bacterium]|nr:penicillin acylase family protein [Deltaproteobacteria bacterium]
VDALVFLRSEPGEEPGTEGFGTSDMDQWLWGLRHYAKFESILADFLGDDPDYAPLTEKFAISTSYLPLEDAIPSGDPRRGLKWFPRPGDQYSVDAANPGTSGTRFSHGSGPMNRMVVSLKGDEVTGQNIIPGGQSALTDSVYFADQASLWLANETTPMRFSVDQVVAGALRRETYSPK